MIFKVFSNQTILGLHIPTQDPNGTNGGLKWSQGRGRFTECKRARKIRIPHGAWGEEEGCKGVTNTELKNLHQVHQNPTLGPAQDNSKVHAINNGNKMEMEILSSE